MFGHCFALQAAIKTDKKCPHISTHITIFAGHAPTKLKVILLQTHAIYVCVWGGIKFHVLKYVDIVSQFICLFNNKNVVNTPSIAQNACLGNY